MKTKCQERIYIVDKFSPSKMGGLRKKYGEDRRREKLGVDNFYI